MIKLKLKPGDRLTREVMRAAHDDGRHGDGSKRDVLAHWATCCCDCFWQHYYEVELGL